MGSTYGPNDLEFTAFLASARQLSPDDWNQVCATPLSFEKYIAWNDARLHSILSGRRNDWNVARERARDIGGSAIAELGAPAAAILACEVAAEVVSVRDVIGDDLFTLVYTHFEPLIAAKLLGPWEALASLCSGPNAYSIQQNRTTPNETDTVRGAASSRLRSYSTTRFERVHAGMINHRSGTRRK